jgi:hypothetical protein
MSDSLMQLQEAVKKANETDPDPGWCNTIITLRPRGKKPSYVVVYGARVGGEASVFCSTLCPHRERVERQDLRPASPFGEAQPGQLGPYRCRLWGGPILVYRFRYGKCVRATRAVELL